MNKNWKQIFQTRIKPKIIIVGDCWEVNLKDNGHGYRTIRVRPNRYYVHRVSYLAFKGEIPEGIKVCHSCDNPACANPDHLFLGTQKVNLEDMTKKGRRKSPHFYGENNPSAKLNWDKVNIIRSSDKSNKELALEYGVSNTLIRKIRNKTIWK